MAKKFFYVCAGLFLLMGAYQMGARDARGQTSGTILGPALDTDDHFNPHFSAVVNGIYCVDGDAFANVPVPGGNTTIATNYLRMVMLANGNVLQFQGSPGSWVTIGQVCGAATPAQSTTWGQVKSTYRK